jgi:hypothetical protein
LIVRLWNIAPVSRCDVQRSQRPGKGQCSSQSLSFRICCPVLQIPVHDALLRIGHWRQVRIPGGAEQQRHEAKKGVGQAGVRPVDKRDPIVPHVIKTLLYTGVRVSELVAIQLVDVDFDWCQIRINEGKGGKDRVVPFPYGVQGDAGAAS